MHFATLGPLRVVEGDTEVDLGGPRQQRVLAVLLAAGGQYLTTDRLVFEVWGDAAPATASHVISTYVSNLRRSLHGRIESDGSHYRLDTSNDVTDSGLLRGIISEATALRRTDPNRAVELLDQADRLWRGKPFGSLTDGSDLLESTATELEELRLRGAEMRIDIELERGNHCQVIPELEALAKAHPYRESLQRSLILALYRADRQAEAVRTGYDLRRRLVDELGMEPSPATRTLEDRVLRQDPNLDIAPPSSLPTPASSFIGREYEAAKLVKHLKEHRLVTMLGIGGIGKTRLAIECAERVRPSFPDGVWFVDLGPLGVGQSPAPKVREALGLMDQPGVDEIALIRRFVARRRLLLVLDPCEHVANDVAALAEAILPAAPGLSILATSRTTLGTPGEARFEVPPMSLPAPESATAKATGTSDAERLYVERASGFDGHFPLDDASARAVADLCVALDGVPLAIELAASRSTVLGPVEILDRLDEQVGLPASPRLQPARHESLAATIDWSYRMLGERERYVFDRLSVFRARFDIAAVETIVSSETVPPHEVPDALSTLGDASMLARRRNPDATVSLGLLQIMRSYARSHLSEEERAELASRHAGYFLDLLERSTSLAFTPGHAAAVELLARSDDDLTAALEWALDNDLTMVSPKVAAGLVHYWYRRGKPAEAYHFGRLLTAADGLHPMAAGIAHLAVAFGSQLVGDFEGAVAAMATAVPIIEQGDDWRMQVFAYNGQGQGAVLAGIPGLSAAMGARILEVCEQHGVTLPRAFGLALLGEEEFFNGGDLSEAERRLSEAIPLFEAIGDEVAQNMFGLAVLAAVEGVQGKFAAGERHALEAAALGGPGWSATALIVLAAYVLIPNGEIDRAESVLLTGLQRVHERSMLAWTRPAFLMLGRIAAARENWEQAARMFGAAKPGISAWARNPMFWTDEPRIRAELGGARYESIATVAAAANLDSLVTELLGGR